MRYSMSTQKEKANCQECGIELEVKEGFHYCPICDTETYFS